MPAWDSIQDQIKNRQNIGNRTKQDASAQAQSKAQPQPKVQTNAQPKTQTVQRKPNGKKPKLRYDRIIMVALLLIALICLLIFGLTKCGSDENTANHTGDNADTTTQVSTQPPQTTLALTAEDVYKGDLILVNEDHVYAFAADDVTLETVYEGRNSCYGVSDMEVSLDSHVIDCFNQLMQAYYEIYENTDIMIVGGYRSKETQSELYDSKKTMLPGGYSDYHTARSFDLVIYPDGTSSNYYAATGDYAWIAENASDYGFILRYPDGKTDQTGISPRAYTFRYVGVPHASYIYNNDICLEEYLELVKNYTADDPLIVDTISGGWNIFYVASDGSGSTQIAIPQGATYTVSGDNIGGFIVAYQEKGLLTTTPTDEDTVLTETEVVEGDLGEQEEPEQDVQEDVQEEIQEEEVQ